MDFTAIIPSRMTSTRLPNKPLADIGGVPMVVRVAQQAALSKAAQVVVAADDTRITEVCAAYGIRALLTRADHASGSDRLAETCDLLGLSDDAVIVNVQGDEPFIEPDLVDSVAGLLVQSIEHKAPLASVGTASHAIEDVADFRNPNVVKLVRDAAGHALYFSRAPIPWWRDGTAANDSGPALPDAVRGGALRHIGIYSYRVGTLRAFAKWPVSPLEQIEALEQLRLMHHGVKIAVHVTDHAPAPGVDTAEDLEKARSHWRKTRESGA